MNKDQVKGKLKDVAGRFERQAGEWTGDPEKQVKGAVKQAEGKLQNAWGNQKDEAKESTNKAKANESIKPVDDSGETETEDEARSRRKVS